MPTPMPTKAKKKARPSTAAAKRPQRRADRTNGKVLIGWREYVYLPDWGVTLRAKADTGARSSAIDVFHLEELSDTRVRFEVATDDRRSAPPKTIEADVIRRARVTSSSGHSHERVFVETRLRLAGTTIKTEVGLVNREKMRWRILLGRRSLEEQFIVNPGRCYVHGRRKRKKRSSGSTERRKKTS